MWSSLISTLFTMRFLLTIIRMATPILFAALGAFTAASTGIGNIAIESIMTFSALAGVLGSYLFNSAWIGVLIGMLCITVRLFNPGYAEGMMLAILLLNTFAPLIDHCVTSVHISRRAKNFKAA